MTDLNSIVQQVLPMITNYGVTMCKNILVALIVFFVGKFLIKYIIKATDKLLKVRKIDPSLTGFLSSIISVTLYLVLAIIIISILGIETSSFIALFTAAGAAIGLALSGTLQNFAGGVMILLFKPFKVGDYIEAQGYAGSVKEIQIFNTILLTLDNQTIIIPNGQLSTNSMKNYSKQPLRRVDITFQAAYGADFNVVKKEIMDIIERNPLILKDPAPFVGITSLGESGINITTRSWCKSADYWTVAGYMNETVYGELRSRSYMFPFNKLDVTIKQ